MDWTMFDRCCTESDTRRTWLRQCRRYDSLVPHEPANPHRLFNARYSNKANTKGAGIPIFTLGSRSMRREDAQYQPHC